jgi:hypothetical protein
MNSLEERVQLLERANRRWRLLGCALCMALACIFIAGQARQNERILELDRLIIRDKAGKPRFVFGSMPIQREENAKPTTREAAIAEEVGLWIFDENRKECGGLTIKGSTPSLWFFRSPNDMDYDPFWKIAKSALEKAAPRDPKWQRDLELARKLEAAGRRNKGALTLDSRHAKFTVLDADTQKFREVWLAPESERGIFQWEVLLPADTLPQPKN